MMLRNRGRFGLFLQFALNCERLYPQKKIQEAQLRTTLQVINQEAPIVKFEQATPAYAIRFGIKCRRRMYPMLHLQVLVICGFGSQDLATLTTGSVLLPQRAMH